jgi:hypothetical protein
LQGNPVIIDVLANDDNTEGATICNVQSGSGGTAVVGDNKITYTPTAGFCGPQTITKKHSKPGCEPSAPATVTVDVVCCPVPMDDAATTLQGNPVIIDVLANDDNTEGATICNVQSGSGGTAAVSNNKITYTPTAGFCGPDTFTYSLCKPDCTKATATVTVTVTCPVCDVTGGGMTFKDNKAKWTITNNGANSVTVSSIYLCWPVANKKLKKIRLNDREIYNTAIATSPASVSSGWRGTVADRTINPGTTSILTLEFEASKASTNQADYCITASFGPGCEVVFVPKPSSQSFCDGTKPNALTMKYTGDGCEATHHSQAAGKVICSGDPNDATPVYIVAKSLDGSKTYFGGIVELGSTFDIDATNAGTTRLDTNTVAKIYTVVNGGQGTLLQTVQFHTSCSQPLIYGDQYGSLELVGYTPQ